MKAYIIARVDITDADGMKQYMSRAPEIVKQFGGRFLVRGGETVTLEGAEESRRIVVMEFASLEDAQAFYHSSQYSEARKLRENAAIAEFIAVQGVE